MKILKDTTTKTIAHRFVQASKLYCCYDRRIIKQILLGDLELLDLIRDDYLDNNLDFSLSRLQKILYCKIDTIIIRIRDGIKFPIDVHDLRYIETYINLEKRHFIEKSAYKSKLPEKCINTIIEWTRDNIKNADTMSIREILNKMEDADILDPKVSISASTLRNILINNGLRHIKMLDTAKVRNYVICNYKKYNKNIFFVERLKKELDIKCAPCTLYNKLDLKYYENMDIHIYSAYKFIDSDPDYYRIVNMNIFMDRYKMLRERFEDLTSPQVIRIIAKSYFYHNPEISQDFYNVDNIICALKYHVRKYELYI